MTTKRPSVLWTKHLRDEAKTEFEGSLTNSGLVLRRLYDILKEFETESTNKEISISEYDSPSWAYKQAYLNGQRSAYTRMKDLLEIFA